MTDACVRCWKEQAWRWPPELEQPRARMLHDRAPDGIARRLLRRVLSAGGGKAPSPCVRRSGPGCRYQEECNVLGARAGSAQLDAYAPSDPADP